MDPIHAQQERTVMSFTPRCAQYLLARGYVWTQNANFAMLLAPNYPKHQKTPQMMDHSNKLTNQIWEWTLFLEALHSMRSEILQQLALHLAAVCQPTQPQTHVAQHHMDVSNVQRPSPPPTYQMAPPSITQSTLMECDLRARTTWCGQEGWQSDASAEDK